MKINFGHRNEDRFLFWNQNLKFGQSLVLCFDDNFVQNSIKIRLYLYIHKISLASLGLPENVVWIFLQQGLKRTGFCCCWSPAELVFVEESSESDWNSPPVRWRLFFLTNTCNSSTSKFARQMGWQTKLKCKKDTTTSTWILKTLKKLRTTD